MYSGNYKHQHDFLKKDNIIKPSCFLTMKENTKTNKYIMNNGDCQK